MVVMRCYERQSTKDFVFETLRYDAMWLFLVDLGNIRFFFSIVSSYDPYTFMNLVSSLLNPVVQLVIEGFSSLWRNPTK